MPAGPIHRTHSHGHGKWDGVGWRHRSVFGALRLRPPLSDMTSTEQVMMLRYAEGAGRIVEIGVFEGASAGILSRYATRELVLIDPYPPGILFGINMAQVIARRQVKAQATVPVRWLQMFSTEAAQGWTDPIDFLRLDGLHTLEGVQGDWEDWNEAVVPGGYAVVRSDVVSETVEDEFAVGDELVPWILERSPGWELADRAETTAIMRRVS